MTETVDALEIPETLTVKQKYFSEEIAGPEIAKQNEVYERAVRLVKAFSSLDAQDVWVGLGSGQEVTLSEEVNWPDVNEHLHMFGNRNGAGSGVTRREKLHLVTFAPVRFAGGILSETEGVSLESDLSEGQMVALPSHLREFKFVESALARMEEAAIADGLLSAPEAEAAASTS